MRINYKNLQIQNLFHFDITLKPDNSYEIKPYLSNIKIQKSIGIVSQDVALECNKTITPPEFNIFDSLKVHAFNNNTANMILSSTQFVNDNLEHINHVANLVNNLHFILGVDSTGLGAFTNEDANSLFRKDWGSDRDWYNEDLDDDTYDVSLSYNPNQNLLKLTIFNINQH